MKFTQGEVEKFLNPDGSINARKVRRSCGGRRGRKEGTKSLKNRLAGKTKLSTRTVVRQKYVSVKNFLNKSKSETPAT